MTLSQKLNNLALVTDYIEPSISDEGSILLITRIMKFFITAHFIRMTLLRQFLVSF